MGGVLDNKPFTQTIEMIFYRRTHRRVTRKIFYVEPDPERFERGELYANARRAAFARWLAQLSGDGDLEKPT